MCHYATSVIVPTLASLEVATPIYVIETQQQDWLAERLKWTGSVRPDTLVPDNEWNQWWQQCKWISPNAWYDLRRNKVATWLTRGKPLTELAHLQRLAGQTITYPNGQVFRYDDLPGLGDPSFRLDLLGYTTSVALIPHEVGHALDLHVLGNPSGSIEWSYLHTAHTWWDKYTTMYPAEAWAEAFAVYVSKLKPLARLVTSYFDQLFTERNWGPWLPNV